MLMGLVVVVEEELSQRIGSGDLVDEEDGY